MNTEDSRDVQLPTEDSPEFKLLLAYTRKKRPADPRLQENNTEQKSRTPEDHTVHRRKKNKRLNKRFSRFFQCIKPRTSDLTDDERQPATLASEAAEKSCSDMENMASELTEISDSVHFPPCDIEADSDDIIQRFADLLREQGDRVNAEVMANKDFHDALRSALTYTFFSKVMDRFFTSVTTELPPQDDDEKTRVALICEATSKLFSVDHHPMNRVLGFGAKYLQNKFPMWVSRNMADGDTEDEEEEVQ